MSASSTSAVGVVAGARAVDELRVTWPARAEVDTTLLARVPADARALIERSTVPVMLPRTRGLAERARFVAKPTFFAASIAGSEEHEGLHLAISATKIVHRHRGIDPLKATATVRGGKPAWVLQNETIWSVSWEEHGVSYVVDLECARPSEDARCESDAAILAIVEELTFVGGSFGASEGAK